MTVQQWLDSGRDYEAGRRLYAALGDNDRLKRMMASGPSEYNREAVAWELTKLAQAGVVANVESLVVTKLLTQPEQNATKTLQKEETPPKKEETITPKGGALLDELRDARRPLYDERSGLHAQLEVVKEEEERRLLCVRIMSLSRQLNDCWDAERHVRAHGCLPPVAAPAPGLDEMTPAQLLKLRNNLRSLVSKLKKNPARLSDLATAHTQLAHVEALLSHE